MFAYVPAYGKLAPPSAAQCGAPLKKSAVRGWRGAENCEIQ
jgi:hypothetical protein